MHGHKQRHSKDKARARFLPATQLRARLEIEPRPGGQGLAIGFSVPAAR